MVYFCKPIAFPYSRNLNLTTALFEIHVERLDLILQLVPNPFWSDNSSARDMLITKPDVNLKNNTVRKQFVLLLQLV